MPGLTAEQILQQKRNARAAGGDGTGGGGDQSAAPPPPQAAAPQMPPRTQTPGTAYGDKWADVFPGTSGYGKPARPGQQSWFDWFSKSYNPSPMDLAKIYGDAWAYHLPALALQATQATGAIPSGYAEAYRAAMEQSRNAAGPGAIGPTALGYLTSPLTYTGVGPFSEAVGASTMPIAARTLPSALAKVVPKAVTGGTQSAITGGAQTAGQGGGVWDTAKSALTNFLLGGAVSGAVSPLARSPVTLDDVAAKTQADLKAAYGKSAAVVQSTATPETTQAAAAAQAQAREAYVQDQISKGVPEWQAKVNAGGPSNQDFIMRQYGGGAAGPGQEAAAAAAAQQAQSAAANAAARTAAKQAQGAETLQRWNDMVNLGQTKAVQGEAADAAMGAPSGPQQTALQGIATATAKKPPEWVEPVRASLPLAGGIAGEGFSTLTGISHGSSVGSGLGTLGSYGLGKAYPTQDLPPLLQQRIVQAAKPMTGYATSPGGDASTLAQALMYIYQNTPQSQQPQ